MNLVYFMSDSVSAVDEALLLAAHLWLLLLARLLLLPVDDSPDGEADDDDAAWDDCRADDGGCVVLDSGPGGADGPGAAAVDGCPDAGLDCPGSEWIPFFVVVAEVPSGKAS